MRDVQGQSRGDRATESPDPWRRLASVVPPRSFARMASLHPVLWTKGTLLTPQHLQAQDRYFDTLLRGQLGALVYSPWGLTRLDIDRAALAGGSVALRAVAGRFADGLLFD